MVSDVFQWKNSSHKTASIGFGSKISNTNRDVDRDVDRTHDQVEQLLEPDQRGYLRGLDLLYFEHFKDGITIDHRQVLRGDANDMWNRAWNTLLNKITAQEQEIADAERLKLENRLAEMIPQLNCIAGSTRNCFTASTIAHTLNENSIAITGLLAQLRNDAIKHESDFINSAYAARWKSYIEGDALDYDKFLKTMDLLKASWHKIDFTDNTHEVIDENILQVDATIQFNRTAGSISDTSGTYDGDYADIIASYPA